MISPADARKMDAELEAIRAELGSMNARIKVLTAELERLKEKLL